MTRPFSDALTLTPTDAGFTAELTEHWTVGTKAHGGVLLALCAKAARDTLAEPGVEPLAVSASYLAAPSPGRAEIGVEVIKRGRTASVAEVVLSRDGRPAVRAVITLGTPDEDEPRHVNHAPGADQPPEPPDDAIDVGNHPVGSVMTLASVCDLRLDAATAAFARGNVDPGAQIRLWVRPHGEEPDALFALMAGDVGPPVTLNLGLAGWAPTVALTALLRARPAPGWLRVSMTSHTISSTWFDEDATVLDSTGRLVSQSRQLAMAPRA